MGIGYVLGCLGSIMAWKLDRQSIFYKLDKVLKLKIKNKIFIQILYILICSTFCYLINYIEYNEINNFITAFLIIDISNTEKENLKQREKVQFYDTISTISRAVVCGFIAPLILVMLLGNSFGIVYMLIYNISMLDEEYSLFKYTHIILTIVPSLVAEVFLYFVYICRNKKSEIDFKGDYFINFFLRPLLNVDILGAYVESVNFYYLYTSKNTDYLKSYGEYSKKIDEICIKDYLSISYGICIIVFILFFILTK